MQVCFTTAYTGEKNFKNKKQVDVSTAGVLVCLKVGLSNKFPIHKVFGVPQVDITKKKNTRF